MSESESARPLLEWTREWAMARLKENGEIMAMAIIKNDEGGIYACLLADWGDTASQRADTLYRLGSLLGFGVKAESVIILSDVWYRSFDIDEMPERVGNLADDPKAEEALVIGEYDKNGVRGFYNLPYTRTTSLETGTVIEFVPDLAMGPTPSSPKMEEGGTFAAFFEGLKNAEDKLAELAERAGMNGRVNDKGEDAEVIARRVARQVATKLLNIELVEAK